MRALRTSVSMSVCPFVSTSRALPFNQSVTPSSRYMMMDSSRLTEPHKFVSRDQTGSRSKDRRAPRSNRIAYPREQRRWLQRRLESCQTLRNSDCSTESTSCRRALGTVIPLSSSTGGPYLAPALVPALSSMMPSPSIALVKSPNPAWTRNKISRGDVRSTDGSVCLAALRGWNDRDRTSNYSQR
jgi:hypothetical protein